MQDANQARIDHHPPRNVRSIAGFFVLERRMWILIVMLLLSGLAIQYQYHMRDKALVRLYKTKLDEANQKLESMDRQSHPAK